MLHRGSLKTSVWVILLSLVLSACIPAPRGGTTRSPPAKGLGQSAVLSPALRSAGIYPAQPLSIGTIRSSDAQSALRAFVETCPRISKRNDSTGLTTANDWRAVCDLARGYTNDAAMFFLSYFTPVTVGNGAAYATGYFEPQILASRTRRPGYEVPIYAQPAELDAARTRSDGKKITYFSRAEIEDGAIADKAAVIAWAADPVELFFLHIQGSGQLLLPDGQIMRVGYAAQNGHPYTGIGGLMRDRGLLGNGRGQYSGSMQGIMAYIRDNPREGRALMRENASYIFFREVTGSGPVGALGVVVRAGDSVAIDPKYVPYGAPVMLEMDRTEASGMWIAQDTGGAIKGANRFDTFWGAGPEARRIAGGMAARGRARILIPNSAYQRLAAR